ncbi:response regulator transcription factor [Roseibium sp. Sym1]|uniref:response regulator transcription factor n=1 Tax=Roseibium sp. Sym1 TaxID=3016006 RepID=UPI0022B523A1|nr:response regulator transcription factor [Roseibium sp. Sym1]
MVQVLLVDDDIELADIMREVLANYSIELHAVHTSEEGLKELDTNRYDVVLLDIMLPRVNGLQLCQEIRYSGKPYKDVSIIMVTARTELTDMVVGLETGADDYIKKPFEPRELVARINSVLRRAERSEPRSQASAAAYPANSPGTDSQIQLHLDNNVLTIDPQRAQLLVNGNKLSITSMEFELIAALVEQPCEILSRDHLLERVHGSSVIYTRSIDALIYRLRNKIRDAGSDVDFIRTVRGRGYSLVGRPAGMIT